MEFPCPTCGVFLNSVDGGPAICKCDGTFKNPPAEEAPEEAPAPTTSEPVVTSVTVEAEPVAEEPQKPTVAPSASKKEDQQKRPVQPRTPRRHRS